MQDCGGFRRKETAFGIIDSRLFCLAGQLKSAIFGVLKEQGQATVRQDQHR
jgi:hypothetical protein